MTRGRAPARGERGSGTVSVLGTAALGAGLLLAVAWLVTRTRRGPCWRKRATATTVTPS